MAMDQQQLQATIIEICENDGQNAPYTDETKGKDWYTDRKSVSRWSACSPIKIRTRPVRALTLKIWRSRRCSARDFFQHSARTRLAFVPRTDNFGEWHRNPKSSARMGMR